jgi:eukaryotic-like serine/threonine-protein kinase
LVEGTVLGGKYRLQVKLGQGGMGSVWRAEHIQLRSPVAVKLIDPAIAEDAEALGRFMREAQSAAALRSPHVVQILDYGADRRTPYIAMELLDGESLAARLERISTLPPAETALAITHVARAMSRAHDAGIIHRDLKPDNVFIVRNDDEEVFKVLDFGIAKSQFGGLDATGNAATRTGALLGTPYYMSPEQVEGLRLIDLRADIWAMGVITYECLVGYRPFTGDTIGSVMLNICSRPLPVPSRVARVPAGFDEWFAKACNRTPEQRFGSAREAAQELRRICGATALEPAESRAPSPNSLTVAEASPPATVSSYSATLGAPQRGTGSRWIAGVAIGVLGLAGLVVGAIAWVGRGEPSTTVMSAAQPPATSPTVAQRSSTSVSPGLTVEDSPKAVNPSGGEIAPTSEPPMSATAAPSSASLANPPRPQPKPMKRSRLANPGSAPTPARPAPKEPSRPAVNLGI